MTRHYRIAHSNLPVLAAPDPMRNWQEGGPKINIRHVPPDSLVAPARELRTHSKKQLAQIAASIRRFGFTSPIQVDANNRIVAGVGRWTAAISLGLETIPVVTLEHLGPTELRLLAIADNKLASLSGWDEKLLKLEVGELMLDLELDLEITGFDTVELDKLTISGSDDEGECVERPDPDQVAITRIGEMFRLGDHLLICGDAREPVCYTRLLGAELARMGFSDPPYNVRIAGNVSGLGKVKHREFVEGSGEMTRREYVEFLSAVFRNMTAFSYGGAIHFQCIDWRHMAEMQVAGEANYAEYKNLIVWNKDNAGMGSFYRSKHELIQVWKVGTEPHVNNFGLGDKGRYRTNVWDYPGANTMRRGRLDDLAAHPTVKPTVLVADAIRDVSKRGEIVLDPFCGSGTTILAAERTGRRARCIEMDPVYVDVAIARWEKATGREAILVDIGITFAALRQARTQHGQ